MNINKIEKRFDKYKRWFKTLLMKEFFNLPIEKQKIFISIAEEFLVDCKRIHHEANNIKEKTFQIKIERIIDISPEKYVVVGKIDRNEIKIPFPSTEKKPPMNGTITCVLYSIDEQIWYSSKTRLTEEVCNG